MGSEHCASVDVWFWSLDVEPAEVEHLWTLLSEAERDRAERFFQKRDRDRWIVSRGRTRELLASVVNASAVTLAFGEEAHGRPYLRDANAPTPSFNVSHSDNLAALAVSFDARVGLDVEKIRPIDDEEIAWALSPAERGQLSVTAPEMRLETFFRFWTLKEAFMKGTGLGAALPLHDFDISFAGPALVRVAGSPEEPPCWRFGETVPPGGMRAAVAARTEGRDLRVTWHTSPGVNDRI